MNFVTGRGALAAPGPRPKPFSVVIIFLYFPRGFREKDEGFQGVGSIKFFFFWTIEYVRFEVEGRPKRQRHTKDFARRN